MSYHLIVWEGERPATDAAGAQQCDEILARYFQNDLIEPTRAIRGFVAALTEFWAHPDRRAAPWGDADLVDCASGPGFWVILAGENGALTSCIVASIAEEHGLVAYDPQTGFLRPVSDEVVAAYWRQRSRA